MIDQVNPRGRTHDVGQQNKFLPSPFRNVAGPGEEIDAPLPLFLGGLDLVDKGVEGAG